MDKAIRFTELIQQSGKPYATTLWSDPEKDSAFQKAIKENRVVTVKQEATGSKRDFGTIGFNREKNVSYFVFPKKLPKMKDAKVIGIKYGLLDQPKTKDPISKQIRASPIQKARKATAQEKEFTATIRRTALWEESIQVKAKNLSEAKKKMETEMSHKKFAESDALVRNELRDLIEND